MKSSKCPQSFNFFSFGGIIFRNASSSLLPPPLPPVIIMFTQITIGTIAKMFSRLMSRHNAATNASAGIRKIFVSVILLIPIFSVIYNADELRPRFLEYVEPKATEIPDDWKDHLHIHVLQARGGDGSMLGCGGCMVLWEILSAIKDLGISTSESMHRCPHHAEMAQLIKEAGDKTLVIVTPEIIEESCHLPDGKKNALNVHWILAPLDRGNPLTFKTWNEEDLVFNYASSTAVHPVLLPQSNILQVITNPVDGDDFDLPPSIFHKTDRNGTAWMMRKGRKWHRGGNITYIHEDFPYPKEIIDPTPEILQSVQYFISYDPYTFYSYAAAMSGAVSIVYPVEGLSKKEWELGTYVGEYLKENGGDVPGIAYGASHEEIKYARDTMPQLRDFMVEVRRWGREKTVERFARDCYRHGNGERQFEAGMTVRDAYTNWYDANDQLISLE